MCLVYSGGIRNEMASIGVSKTNIAHFAVFLCAEITTVIWFALTKRSGISASAVWEVCYLPILITIGVAIGDAKLTPQFLAGSGLVMAGISVILLER